MMKNIFKKLLSSDDSHEFHPLLSEIEEQPVNPLGRLLFWIVVGLFVMTILWAIIGKVDVIISARGIIIPKGDMKIIQSLETGVVKQILVTEGSFVTKNQVLMEIDPATTEPELESLKSSLSQIQLEMKRLKSLSEGAPFQVNPNSYNQKILETQTASFIALDKSQTRLIDAKKSMQKQILAKIESLTEQGNSLKKSLVTNKEKLARLEKVMDIIARSTYDETKDLVQKEESEILQIDSQIKELKHQYTQIDEEIGQIKAKFTADILSQLIEKQLQATQLEARIQESAFKHGKQKILSPVAGYVVQMESHTIGAVVIPAQKLLTIVPMTSDIMIKATVLNKDIGFVKDKMAVTLKIDTFNFQKYGTLKGKIFSISKNSIQDEKLGPIYEVFIIPLEKELIIDGKKEFMTPGMTLTAEIKTGKRRIIEFFLYPLIRYWDEGMSVK